MSRTKSAAAVALAARNAALLDESTKIAETPKEVAPVNTSKPAPKSEVTKAIKTKPLCGCGCGQRTGGGIFRPGHDAKLKSQLFATARGNDAEAAAKATAELSKRGWLWLMAAPKVKVAKPTKAEVEASAEDDAAWQAMVNDEAFVGLNF